MKIKQWRFVCYFIVIGLIASLTLGMAACNSTTTTTTVPTLSSIIIVPAEPANLIAGANQQFTATGTYSDGSTADITFAVTWASDTPAVAIINSAGTATGITDGIANITATLSGITSPAISLTAVATTTTVIAPIVPPPAPVPWSTIVTYTAQTDQIEAKVGEEFAIGMYASILPMQYMKSYDQNYVSLIYDQVVDYLPSTAEGTEWFLFKAIKEGTTEIVFQYPLEYTKIFKISIN